MRFRREVFELRFWWKVSQLGFRREVGELRLRGELSRFGGEFRHLRFGGQIAQLRPVCQRSLMSGFSWRGGLLEDLWRKAGLIHRRVVNGVDLAQCHWRNHAESCKKHVSNVSYETT